MTLEELARAHPFARPLKVPDWTLGVWRRRSITFADGREDDTTEVWWLQSHGLTGDIRIPANRPDLSHRTRLSDCTREELIGLCEAEGGVADTHWDGRLMTWTDWSAFQPLNRWPEPGDLRHVGGCMIEFAPSGAYVEDWRAQPTGNGLRVGLRLIDERRIGGLIITGDLALLSLGRRTKLADAPLAEIVASADDLAGVVESAFEAMTCLARWDGAGFRVTHATNPFVEGTRLELGDFAIDAPGRLAETGAGIARMWAVDTLTAG